MEAEVRRHSFPLALARALFATLVGTACAEVDSRTSVILVSWDAVRADHTSLYGYERSTTPELDALAGEALVFDRAHTTQPFTLSHMAMLCGLYPSVHGVDEDHGLNPRIPMLAERLEAQGYDTLALYHSGWIDARYGFDRGFDTFRHHWTAEEASANLAEEWGRLEDGPFFLFLHLFDAHNVGLDDPSRPVYDPPEEYRRRWVADAPERLRGTTPRELYEDEIVPTADQLEAVVALYDGGVAYLDAVLGEWVDEFRRRGILDRALLIVTADHGESLGTRGRFYGHGEMYQEGLWVPLVIRWPSGHRAGEREAGVVSHVDLVPTVLHTLGLERDAWLSGYSLLEGRPAGSPVLAQVGGTRAVIEWPYKMIQRGTGWNAEIYHLERDPGELRPAESGGKFRGLVERFAAVAEEELGRPAPVGVEAVSLGEMPVDELEEMRALGYLGEE